MDYFPDLLYIGDYRPVWPPYCPQEGANILVGHNEPCNWCGATALIDLDKYDHYGEGD